MTLSGTQYRAYDGTLHDTLEDCLRRDNWLVWLVFELTKANE